MQRDESFNLQVAISRTMLARVVLLQDRRIVGRVEALRDAFNCAEIAFVTVITEGTVDLWLIFQFSDSPSFYPEVSEFLSVELSNRGTCTNAQIGTSLESPSSETRIFELLIFKISILFFILRV